MCLRGTRLDHTQSLRHEERVDAISLSVCPLISLILSPYHRLAIGEYEITLIAGQAGCVVARMRLFLSNGK